MLIRLMDRFSYPSLDAARQESAEVLRLLEIIRLGTPEGGETDFASELRRDRRESAR